LIFVRVSWFFTLIFVQKRGALQGPPTLNEKKTLLPDKSRFFRIQLFFYFTFVFSFIPHIGRDA